MGLWISVQFSHSVVSNSLRPHGLQHARLPCPSPTPGACSISCPSSRWCHPTISSSVITFSSCLQSFPASRCFLRSQFFASDGQSIGASASVLPVNIQDWFPLGLTGLISLQSKGLSRNFSNVTSHHNITSHHSSKAPVLQCSAFFMVQLSHPYMTTRKIIALTRQTFVGRVMSLLFNILSRLVTAFFPRSKCLLISWLQSPSAVILEPKKIKFVTVSIVSPSICHEVMGPDAMILVFWMLSFNPAFSLSSFTFIKRLFSSSLLSAIRVVSSAYLKLLIFLYIKKMWKWKSLNCVWLRDPMDYTVHGILQARILEWVAFPFSRGSSQPRDWTQVSRITGGFFTSWTTREAHIKKMGTQYY